MDTELRTRTAGSEEAGVVLDLDGCPFYWHLPGNRSCASIPDSRTLWEVFRDNVDKISGFAHSHPGGGVPGPSWEDLTTFAAMEAALAKRFDWWIISRDRVILVRWDGGRYRVEPVDEPPAWVRGLHKASYQ